MDKFEYMSGRRPETWREVGIMADLANPTRMSEFALGLSRPGYMRSWASYVTGSRFAYRPHRLARCARRPIGSPGRATRSGPRSAMTRPVSDRGPMSADAKRGRT